MPEVTSGSSRSNRRDILLLAIGQTLVWASIYYIFPALLLRWEQDLGWSKPQLTGALTLAVLASAGASPLAGRLIDRGKGAVLMAGASVLGGSGVLGLSVMTALWQFYLLWLVIGVAMAGCLYEPCFAIVTRARGAGAKQGIIFITLVAGFASTISFPVAHLLAEAFGWRVACRVFAAVAILVVAPLLLTAVNSLERRNGRATTQPEKGKTHVFLRNPAFWFLGFGFALLAMSHGATLHHLLPILDSRGVPADMAVLAASFIGPMQVTGRLAFMASQRRMSHHGVALLAFSMMGASIFLLLLAGASPVAIAGFVFLFGSAYGTVSILRPLLARDILGEDNFGAKSGALAVPYLAGSASAPFLASVVWGWGGYTLVLSVLMVVIATGCGLYLFANRAVQRRLV